MSTDLSENAVIQRKNVDISHILNVYFRFYCHLVKLFTCFLDINIFGIIFGNHSYEIYVRLKNSDNFFLIDSDHYFYI